VVEGDAIALGNALCQRFGGRVVAHGRFGTAKWWIAGQRAGLAEVLETSAPLDPDDLPESLDLISARVEFYEYPTALPTVERSSIKLDLHRRDFTINTMAIRLDGRHYGDLYDYWGGLIDLRQGVVRVLHSLSFVDDPTRMLRAVRFEQRFGFRIEARTLQLMADAHPMVPQVSGERLRHELDLMLSEANAIAMFDRLAELGLLRAIHPGLEWNAGIAERVSIGLTCVPDPIWDLPEVVGHIPLARVLAYVAWFGALQPEQAQTVGDLLRMPVVVLRAIAAVHSLRPQLAGWVNTRPSLIVEQLETYPRLALFALQMETESEAIGILLQRFAGQWRQIEPLTNGDDLRARGVPPGPAYRAILSALRQGWLDGEITSEEEERERLEGLISELV
jgi:tRNA nucleotidyltransferase (CCA-adding enzyme)